MRAASGARDGNSSCTMTLKSDQNEMVIAVELRGLAKSYGGFWAVTGLDLEIPQGSFFGLVGPNGAGKSTTLRMATGLLRPNRGTAIVDGIDVWADPVAAKRRMGILT